MSNFIDDDAPKLSVAASDDIRLYREPGNVIDYSSYSSKDFQKEIANGVLFPSITTVLNVLNSPYLVQWAANLSAKEAVRVGLNWPERYKEQPEKAFKHLRAMHSKELTFAQNRGTRIHKILELVGKGENVPMILNDEDKACIRAWENFVKDFGVNFEYQELTGLGKTHKNLKFGGTTDFIGTIDKETTVAGDYKCSTLETEILMEDGTTVAAKDIKEGDRIVAWDNKRNLHVQKVAWTADNGIQDIIQILTSHGQKLEVTKEHPILITRDNRIQWVPAGNIQKNDVAYLATGWNHNPHRVSQEWGHKVSPYAVGAIWALVNSKGAKTKGGYKLNPNISKLGIHELELLGVEIVPEDETDEDNKNLVVLKSSLVKALNRNNKTKTTPFADIFKNNKIPKDIFETNTVAQEGFISGIREIFAPRNTKAEEYVVGLGNETAVASLQHLYLNIGVLTTRTASGNTFLNEITAPIVNSDELTKHGPVATNIVSKKVLPAQPTIAIEIENSHTHVTNGIITHNTTRSGLHKTVALQLTAFKNTDTIIPDLTKPAIATPKIDAGIAVHIAPDKYEVKLANTSDDVWGMFEALREIWFLYAFDGKLTPDAHILSPKMKDAKELVAAINASVSLEKL